VPISINDQLGTSLFILDGLSINERSREEGRESLLPAARRQVELEILNSPYNQIFHFSPRTFIFDLRNKEFPRTSTRVSEVSRVSMGYLYPSLRSPVASFVIGGPRRPPGRLFANIRVVTARRNHTTLAPRAVRAVGCPK